MIFEAHFSFECSYEKFREERTKIVYKSKNTKTAIADAFRWFRNRQQCNYDYFKKLYCVKIARYPIGNVDEKGYLMTGGCLDFFEWKYDWWIPAPDKENQ